MGWTIEVPDVPPSLNQVLNMHWRRRSKLKKHWLDQYYLFPRDAQHILRNNAFNQGKVRMNVTLFNARTYDKDNAYGACKVIVDGAVRSRLVYDDRPEFLELEIKQEHSTRKEKRTVIELQLA